MDESDTGENNTGEAGLVATLKARRLRMNPPHMLLSGDGTKTLNELPLGLSWNPPQALLASREAGDCSDGKIFGREGWESDI